MNEGRIEVYEVGDDYAEHRWDYRPACVCHWIGLTTRYWVKAHVQLLEHWEQAHR